MGEVADIRSTREAGLEAVDTRIAFESFFEDEKDRLLRILSVITGSRAEAEDIAQEAFTRVFERWATVGTMDNPAGYLHRTAMNLFRNQYRRARVALARAVRVGPEQDGFKPVEDRDAAARALGALAPRQRAALVQLLRRWPDRRRRWERSSFARARGEGSGGGTSRFLCRRRVVTRRHPDRL